MKIAIVTDTHVAPSAGAFNANCLAALEWIGKQDAELIVHLGDITVDGAHDAAQLGFAVQLFAAARQPVRFIPGNHDIGDNPVPGLDGGHSRLAPERLELYRQVFGDDRWRFDIDGWTLIGLNAQLFGFGDEREAAQFAWLEAALADVGGPLGLCLHKPLFRSGWDDTERHPRYVPLAARRRLRALLAPRDLRFVVSGHTHQWRRLTVEGVDHVWAPSCAFTVPDLMQEWIGEKRLGLLMLELAPERHAFELCRPAGLATHDLADHPDTYPTLGPLLARLRRGQPYERR